MADAQSTGKARHNEKLNLKISEKRIIIQKRIQRHLDLGTKRATLALEGKIKSKETSMISPTLEEPLGRILGSDPIDPKQFMQME